MDDVLPELTAQSCSVEASTAGPGYRRDVASPVVLQLEIRVLHHCVHLVYARPTLELRRSYTLE